QRIGRLAETRPLHPLGDRGSGRPPADLHQEVASRRVGSAHRRHSSALHRHVGVLSTNLGFARLSRLSTFATGTGSSLWKKGGQEEFDHASLGQIPLYPLFQRGNLKLARRSITARAELVEARASRRSPH